MRSILRSRTKPRYSCTHEGFGLLDIQPMHDLAGRPGLVRYERGPEHALRGGGDFLVSAAELDAAGLAAAAGVNLRLDRPMPAAQFGRDIDGLLGTVGDTAGRHRDAKAGQQFFCLIFVYVHRTPDAIAPAHPSGAPRRKTEPCE